MLVTVSYFQLFFSYNIPKITFFLHFIHINYFFFSRSMTKKEHTSFLEFITALENIYFNKQVLFFVEFMELVSFIFNKCYDGTDF